MIDFVLSSILMCIRILLNKSKILQYKVKWAIKNSKVQYFQLETAPSFILISENCLRTIWGGHSAFDTLISQTSILLQIERLNKHDFISLFYFSINSVGPGPAELVILIINLIIGSVGLYSLLLARNR